MLQKILIFFLLHCDLLVLLVLLLRTCDSERLCSPHRPSSSSHGTGSVRPSCSQCSSHLDTWERPRQPNHTSVVSIDASQAQLEVLVAGMSILLVRSMTSSVLWMFLHSAAPEVKAVLWAWALPLHRVPGPVWGGPLGAQPLAEPLHLPWWPQLGHPAARPLCQLPVQGHCY